MKTVDRQRKYPEGRDEMNLADFPISALQRAQKCESDGRKVDRLEFEATRYDPTVRQRVQQKVTLTSTARDGLPTPADEHVVLALLHVAKHGNNFAEATVHFAPSQLFDIMGWAPNGRSYTRLRDVLRRLKSLTIRYENAWWDAIGRGYEEEVATGIISGYRIARQVSGPRRTGNPLASWVTWTQQFHESLQNGNLKRLDLDVFFSLRTPTAQRMYRFLDKRFYNHAMVSLDLVDFACGHIGLTDAGNVALLKRRLSPAIAELEAIGFIRKVPAAERYQKLRAGEWKVTFHAVDDSERKSNQSASPVLIVPKTLEMPRDRPVPVVTSSPEAATLAAEFYRLWNPTAPTQPGPRDREQAEALIREHGIDGARALLACLVQVIRTEWPDCRSLSGAAQKYLGDAIKLLRQKKVREDSNRRTEQDRRQARQDQANQQEHEAQLEQLWQVLSSAERDDILQAVRARLGDRVVPEVFIHRLCLAELTRHSE
jgi:Replication initiator protein A